MHENPTISKDYFIGVISKFNQGGVNLFDTDQEFGKEYNNLNGFTGWNGYGGSILQYHRELEIGFAFAMNLVSSEALFCRSGETLKRMVYEIV